MTGPVRPRVLTGAVDGPPGDAELAARFAPLLERVAAGEARREAERELPVAQVRELLAAGFGALRVARSHGGAGVGLDQLFALVVDVAAADANVAHLFRGHFAFLEQALTDPDPAVRERWAEVAVGGGLVGNASSETGNGGLWDTRTTVRHEEATGRWRLDGVKYYSTGTLYADWVSVGAVLDDGRRVSVPVSTRAPGVTVVDDWDGFGQRLTGSGTTRFEDVDVDPSTIVPFEDRSPSVLGAFYQLYLLAVLAGIARAVARDAVAFVLPRERTFGTGDAPPPRHDPLVQAVVGRLTSSAFAAEALVAAAARRLDALTRAAARGPVAADAHVAVDVAAFQAQVTVTELVLRAATELFEVGGASATATGRALDRHWRNARTIASHNPVTVRAQLLGAHALLGEPPGAGAVALRVPGPADERVGVSRGGRGA